jgi:hypothetical protein
VARVQALMGYFFKYFENLFTCTCFVGVLG